MKTVSHLTALYCLDYERMWIQQQPVVSHLMALYCLYILLRCTNFSKEGLIIMLAYPVVLLDWPNWIVCAYNWNSFLYSCVSWRVLNTYHVVNFLMQFKFVMTLTWHTIEPFQTFLISLLEKNFVKEIHLLGTLNFKLITQLEHVQDLRAHTVN